MSQFKKSLKIKYNNPNEQQNNSISKHTRSLIRTMRKKYSSHTKKKIITNIAESKEFVNKRIESNQLKITKFKESLQKKNESSKIFNLVTNPQLMESILFLVKMTICVVLLPLIMYLKNHPNEVLNYKNLYQFFIIQHSETVTKILTQSSLEHPVAISFLTEKFVYNPLGKILMRFSLFRGVVEAINHIKEKKEKLEIKIMEVIGRSLFNYETFYALKYALESFNIPEGNLSTIEKSKYISKASGTVLTIFDLILCGTKSSWCQSLQPIQRVTFVFPIFVELGIIIYDVVEGCKRKGDNLGPLEIITLGFQHYCKKTYNLDNNLYTDFKTFTIQELEKSFIRLDYQGPKEIQTEYEAKLKMYQLMSDPHRLLKMAKNNPNFGKEFKELLIESELTNLKNNSNLKAKIEADANIIIENLNNYNITNLYCQLYRKTFKIEQAILKEELKDKSDKLLLGPLGRHKISKFRFRYKPWYKAANVLASLYTFKVGGTIINEGTKLFDEALEAKKLISVFASRLSNLRRPQNWFKTADKWTYQIIKELNDKRTTLLTNFNVSKNKIIESSSITNLESYSIFNISNMGYINKLVGSAVLISNINSIGQKDTRVDDLDSQIDNITITENKTASLNSLREKRLKQEKEANQVIFSSLLFGLVNSITGPNKKINNKVALETLHKLLDDKYLTPEQTKEIQTMINDLEKV